MGCSTREINEPSLGDSPVPVMSIAVEAGKVNIKEMHYHLRMNIPLMIIVVSRFRSITFVVGVLRWSNGRIFDFFKHWPVHHTEMDNDKRSIDESNDIGGIDHATQAKSGWGSKFKNIIRSQGMSVRPKNGTMRKSVLSCRSVISKHAPGNSRNI